MADTTSTELGQARKRRLEARAARASKSRASKSRGSRGGSGGGRRLRPEGGHTYGGHRGHRGRRRAVAAIAALAFVLGAIVALAGGSSPSGTVALSFARAWARGDYAAMYADIDAHARGDISMEGFAAAYKAANRTATAQTLHLTSGVREQSGGVQVIDVRVHTYLFGTLHEQWRLPTRSEGSGARIAWTGALVFPGMRGSERLTRQTELPPRASILARNGLVLAEGSPPPGSAEGERASALGPTAGAVVGDVGPIPAAQRNGLEAQGVPGNATVGTSGLELAFDARLRGKPGGELLEGGRVIARATAVPARPLRTTISPAIQRAAVLGLGGQLGGVLALRPQTGEVLAVAGLGTNDEQPPGSTFKMVTVTGILQAGIASLSSTYPDRTETTLEGVKLENAGGESCGGPLTEAFAVSCNSVFIPLGVQLGAKRLVKTAEAFGFNQAPVLPGATESTLPAASQFQGEVELGSSAIGQGKVLASPLQMAEIAGTVANGGLREQPTFLPVASAHASTSVRVMSSAIAGTVTHLMLAVVQSGIGTAAAIPGVEVAGKTGTAELGSSPCGGASEGGAIQRAPGQSEQEGESCASKERHNTDAWFASFAPASDARVAVGVMLVRDGYGGETAAPIARQVMEAALEKEG